ncbi:uncharacterized protein [Amphiura filiformis]|uniref:uncharacterized protein n=1 Tax=Amphiura filiformis TaxID=82378 RepID=UPI003B21A4E6
MPLRMCWKKDWVPEASARKKVEEMKTKNNAKARELMQKNSRRETYPQKDEMRIRTGRLNTGPGVRSTKSLSPSARTSRAATSHPVTATSRDKVAPRHATCSGKSHKNAFRMEKYSGECSPPDPPSNVLDLSKQHLLTMLHEASATLVNETKMAERKQCQSQLHYYHQTSHQHQPEKSWQKAMHQLKPHYHDTSGLTKPKITDALESEKRSISRPATVRALGKSRRSGASSASGGIAKQLGQRVTYEEGTLNPKTGRPPTVPPSKQRKQPVFNMESSRTPDLPVEKVNYRLPKMSNDQTGAWETSKEWSVGYALERKLSNTLKGGDVIAQMRRTPYAM